MRVPLPALAGLIAVSGCLPQRDNPSDPANAPAPALQVLDRTDIAGGCLAVSTSSAWPSVTEASRGACLALDARGSSDPQNTPDAQLTFAFSRVLDDGSSLPFTVTGSSSALALLPDASLSDLPDGALATFHVRVTDPTDAWNELDLEFRARNAAPIVHADPPRTIPLHGHPWGAVDEDVALQFHATAFDPDGDEITGFEWTRADGSVAGSGDRVSINLATSDRTRHVVRVTATDGDRTSEPAQSIVYVDEPNFWEAAVDPQNGIRRIVLEDSRVRIFSELGDAGEVNLDDTRAIGFASAGSGTFVMLATTTELVVATWPDMLLVDHVPLGLTAPSGISQDDTGRILVFSFFGNVGDPIETGAWTFDGQALSASPVQTILSITSSQNAFGIPGPDVLSAEGPGGTWITARFSRLIDVLDVAAGTSSAAPGATDALGASGVWTALSSRPGNPGEMWAIRGRDPLDSTAVDAAAIRFAGGTTTVFPLGSGDASTIGWIDSDRFWTNIAEHGACVVDVPILEVAEDPAAAMQCIPTLHGFTSVAVDPVTGTAFWSTASALYGMRTDLDGSYTTFVTFSAAVTLDPAGAPWFVRLLGQDGGDLVTARLPTLGGQGLASAESTATDATLDGEGGVWIAGFNPNVIRRIGESGAISDVILEIETAEGIRGAPLVLSMDESDGYLWVIGLDDAQTEPLLRIDTRAPRSAPGRAPAEIMGTNVGGFPTVFQPIGGVVPSAGTGAWIVVYNFFSPGTIRWVDGSGYTDLPAMPGAEERNGEISPASDRFCYGERANTTASLQMLEPPPAGAVATSSWNFAGSTLHLRAVNATVTTGQPGTELCWITLVDSSVDPERVHIYAIDDTGTRVRTYEDDAYGDVLDVFASGPDRLWVLRETPNPDRVQPQRIDFDPVTGDGILQFGLLERADVGAFVDR